MPDGSAINTAATIIVSVAAQTQQSAGRFRDESEGESGNQLKIFGWYVCVIDIQIYPSLFRRPTPRCSATVDEIIVAGVHLMRLLSSFNGEEPVQQRSLPCE